MKGKVTFLICFTVSLCALRISADDEFFKVPLEVREKNRPERLVDNSEDPDMRALKDVQDKFFTIVSNSSVGKEFKSFKQLLHLVDSEAGIEIGRLMFQGFMIAYGKDNSNQLLNEFIDDFQYRAPPKLADALIDYKDFLKTVDLKMIPLTLQTLFRKDELGNSLAQIPLGQLVDLVQPEASKYGIDIKAVVNGILGKGDSTFPDLVKKLLGNFNASSVLKSLASLKSSKIDEETSESVSDEMKRQRKDLKNPALMLFKPFIAKILKENKIDLEPDAVIQVLTPFVAPILQSFMPSGTSKDGKQQGGNFDFSQILPMLTLLGSQMGGSKVDTNRLERTIEPELAGYDKQERQGSKRGRGDSMGNLMNMVSGLLQMSDNLKKGKIDDSEAGKEQDLLQLAMALMGNMGGKGKKDDQMANLLNLATGALQMSGKNGKEPVDSSAKTMELLQSAMSLMGNAGDKKSGGNPMAGLLSLASAFMGNKKDGKDGDPMAGLLGLASSFMGNQDGSAGDPMASLVGLTSSLKEAQKDGKTDLFQMITGVLGGPNGKQIISTIKMAAALFGSGRKKRRDAPKDLADTLESEDYGSEERRKWINEYKEAIKSDPRYMAAKENLENALGEMKERQNETVSELSHDADETFIDKEITKEEEEQMEQISSFEFDRTKSLPYAIEKYLGKMQQEERDISKLQQVFTEVKGYFATKFDTREHLEDFISSYLSPIDPSLNVQALTAPFFLSEIYFEQFLNQITKKGFSEHSFVTSTSGMLIKRFLDRAVISNVMTSFGIQLSNILSQTGTQEVTFDNFPEKLNFIATLLTKKQGLPDDLPQLLYPLQYSMKSMSNWYKNVVLKHSSASEDELREIFVESFFDEIILPIKHLWKIHRVSKASKSCLPREVCEFVNNIDEENVIETIVAQIGSIIYGGFVSEGERNPYLFMLTVRAAVYQGDCEEAFPFSCDKKESEMDDDDFKYEHIEL